LLTGSHAGQAAVALGFLLMLYAVLGLTSVRFSVAPAAEWWLGPLIGALTGLATAATGVFAIPAVPPSKLCQAVKEKPNLKIVVFPGATHAFNMNFAQPIEYLGHHMAHDENATQEAQKDADTFMDSRLK
jgi:hypothetical protein